MKLIHGAIPQVSQKTPRFNPNLPESQRDPQQKWIKFDEMDNE